MEHNLIEALIASRQLFKDIVACSADFAWETAADGRFSFVSPRGALGFSARELNQRRARRLLDPEHEPPDPLPFESRVALDQEELWVRRADGRAACLSVSCVPVYDAGGVWRGVRGLCRDVTAAREREAALARARNREGRARLHRPGDAQRGRTGTHAAGCRRGHRGGTRCERMLGDALRCRWPLRAGRCPPRRSGFARDGRRGGRRDDPGCRLRARARHRSRRSCDPARARAPPRHRYRRDRYGAGAADGGCWRSARSCRVSATTSASPSPRSRTGRRCSACRGPTS
ncbi:MAG: PAS domain S-box protein [Alphaproteobacteria bacterium]|nr:PAS domain S-box protein [Alphaproteobacteria bacterium]